MNEAFASRLKDWMDVEGIIARQAGKLDWDYVIAQLTPLADLKKAPDLVHELQRRRKEFGQ